MADEDATIHDFHNHPGFALIAARVKERKEQDTRTLAFTMLSSTSAVDQRLIDEGRGFWKGTEFFLREIKKGSRAFEHEVEETE